jgi:hypothetical protein
MDKEASEIIKEQRRKGREETNQKHVANSHTITNKAVERLIKKQYKVDFN